MLEHLARWIYTSVAYHYDNQKKDIALYFDRNDHDTDWAEFRLDGPYIDQKSMNQYDIEVTVNILITCFISDDDYKIQRMIGIISEACTNICCYRFGDGSDDDQSYLFNLSPDSGISVFNFGLIAPENRYRRSSVEITFKSNFP